MDTQENVTKVTNEVDSTSVVMPTGLLSVVDALCQRDDGDGFGYVNNSRRNCSNNNADDTNDVRMDDLINNSNDSCNDNSFNIDNSAKTNYNRTNDGHFNHQLKTSEISSVTCQYQQHSHYYSNMEQRNQIYERSQPFTLQNESDRNSPSKNVQDNYHKEEQNVIISKTELQTQNFPDVTILSSGRVRIDVATYTIKRSRIILIPDLYKAVRQAGGTCSPLRAQLNKLSIVPKRFDPFQMLRLKHVGAVGLEVKCCSYILLEECLQVITNYKDKNITPEAFNILAPVDVTTPVEVKDLKFTFPSSVSPNVSAATNTVSTLHTFIVNDQIVTCFVELQQVFEAMFGNVFLLSLSKLDICSRKFTALQMDEVMDFVDIDEANVPSAGFFVTKKDAERIFQYAEALFNVDRLQIKWLDPLRLSSADSQANADKPSQRKDPLSSFNSQNVVSTFSVVGETSRDEQKASGFERDEKDEDDRLDVNKLQEPAGSVGKFPGKSVLDNNVVPNEKHPNDSHRATNVIYKDQTLRQKTQHSLENISQESDDVTSHETENTEFHNKKPENNDGSDAKAHEPPSASCSAIDLTSFEDHDDITSSLESDDSLHSDLELGSCSSISTYIIDGEEVVCIPDIHKIIIHLYGQSVQVGYYLQRLQIPTQRFSTMHVKRLKALNALNSKATLCTYILKSDALRLVKMYDVFCNESKLQHIQWNGPVSLEGIQSVKLPNDESTSHRTPPPSVPQEPIEVVKIPTFLIDGEIVVSVPDAHKVVQVLNGQSVQVRYNMDKLGIIKRRYSYSQVYQLRAISDLKRPSMCTFITKSDADKLLEHYLTVENVYRLQYIHWIPPVQLGERRAETSCLPQDGAHEVEIKTEETAHYDASCYQDSQGQGARYSENGSFERLPPGTEFRHRPVDQPNECRLVNIECPIPPSSTISQQISCPRTITHQQISGMATLATTEQNSGEVALETAAVKSVEVSKASGLQNSDKVSLVKVSSIPGSAPMGTIGQIPGVVYRAVSGRVDMATSNSPLPRGDVMVREIPISHGVAMATGTSQMPCTVVRDTVSVNEKNLQPGDLIHAGKKRTYETIKEKDNISLEIKRLKDEKNDIAANLERKETEMKILHDVYQQQVASERKRRLEAEKEIEELKASNAELCKNLQRKESEMKILHDSYQYQIRKEREKRQELESELIDLRGSVAFASGVAIPDVKIKQENPF